MSSPHTAVEPLMPYLFVTLTTAVALGFFLQFWMYRILRTRHPEIYDSLGRPTLFLNNSIQNSFAVQKFIFLGRFRQIDDPELVRLCTFLRAFSICYTISFFCLAIFGSSLAHPPR
jgi:hypothetical protein